MRATIERKERKEDKVRNEFEVKLSKKELESLNFFKADCTGSCVAENARVT